MGRGEAEGEPDERRGAPVSNAWQRALLAACSLFYSSRHSLLFSVRWEPLRRQLADVAMV